ncbi:hypothetical protein PLUTO_00980 [Luteibacter phage vB_LflM-Pluto]|uniref:Uncharacterized protein n=1 Tax=Luteibacter phage vB_LflM-Pluto TaxID=2948611 RepID=A0A9E7MUP1_9CAUD|nr:hypothetical protein PLUTO_00980 [Luteibacter phage vB_LflM-Pluto]
MSLTPTNTDIMQAAKWMQNKAPNLLSLLQQKKDWYDQYHKKFWSDWNVNVFDLRTANPFGLMIWCIILNVPSQLFGLYGTPRAWAYGDKRQNFVYSGGAEPATDRNTIGGNFAGGQQTTILSLQEVRWALRLRYVALICNGRIAFINKMLRYIFNDDQPWDFGAGRYFYVVDSTFNGDNPISDPFTLEYRIGPNMGLSAQLITLLNNETYGITPTCAGSKFTVVLEP